jgi:putative endonuclease
MYYVYVLLSEKNGRRYIGLTGKKPAERLIEHNQGSNVFTKHNRPFRLIYFEKYQDQEFAIKREKFLKTGHGRNFLNRKLSNIV